MNAYIALLRGVNVGGKNKIPMKALAALFEGLKFQNVKTYIQSGNVVFNSRPTGTDRLRQKIETAIEKELGLTITTLVLTKEALEELANGNAFLRKKAVDPSKLHATFLSEAPDKSALADIQTPKSGEDAFIVAGKTVCLHCPNGYGKTKFSNGFFEKKLGVHATTRNWRTVSALVELVNVS